MCFENLKYTILQEGAVLRNESILRLLAKSLTLDEQIHLKKKYDCLGKRRG